jgi:hypothetical protein
MNPMMAAPPWPQVIHEQRPSFPSPKSGAGEGSEDIAKALQHKIGQIKKVFDQ